MKINPKNGIDQLLFGMKKSDVTAIYGNADKEFKDDDNNQILVYNNQKWRLTFYEDEAFRLGYIIVSDPLVELFEKKIIGKNVEEIKQQLIFNDFKSWEKESFDIAENHFNEDNWLVLQTEFGVISNVELGAIINNKDAFEWKFGAK